MAEGQIPGLCEAAAAEGVLDLQAGATSQGGSDRRNSPGVPGAESSQDPVRVLGAR